MKYSSGLNVFTVRKQRQYDEALVLDLDVISSSEIVA